MSLSTSACFLSTFGNLKILSTLVLLWKKFLSTAVLRSSTSVTELSMCMGAQIYECVYSVLNFLWVLQTYPILSTFHFQCISRDMGSAAEGQDSRAPACQDSTQWKLAPNIQKKEMTFMTLTLWPWDQYGILTLSIPTYFMNMIKIEGH